MVTSKEPPHTVNLMYYSSKSLPCLSRNDLSSKCSNNGQYFTRQDDVQTDMLSISLYQVVIAQVVLPISTTVFMKSGNKWKGKGPWRIWISSESLGLVISGFKYHILKEI